MEGDDSLQRPWGRMDHSVLDLWVHVLKLPVFPKRRPDVLALNQLLLQDQQQQGSPLDPEDL